MSDENGGKKFVNCYDGYDNCKFAVPIKDGVPPEKFGEDILEKKREVYYYSISDNPEGPICKY